MQDVYEEDVYISVSNEYVEDDHEFQTTATEASVKVSAN